MAFFDELLPDVNHYAPNCPEMIAVRELRRAAITFFNEVPVYTHTTDIPVTAGKNRYVAPTPLDTTLSQVLSVSLNGKKLNAIIPNSLEAMSKGNGRTDSFYEQNNTLTLTPTPQQSGTLTLRVAVKPTRDANELDDTQMDRWVDAIVNQAVFRLTSMPERTWSNPSIAQAAQAMYESEKFKAQKSINGKQNKTTQARFRW